MSKKVTVAGLGYVGLTTAVFMAECGYEVCGTDTDGTKAGLVASGIVPFTDGHLSRVLPELIRDGRLHVKDADEAYDGADYVFIAVPTNYDAATGFLDAGHLLETIKTIKERCPEAHVVIRSTLCPGFTQKLDLKSRAFFPEFLREKSAYDDVLSPSRIIAGVPEGVEREPFAELSEAMRRHTGNKAPVFLMSSTEAEIAKMMSNTYLAMRIAFFNELDMLSDVWGCSTSRIMEGITSDPRIGSIYSQQSIGYGGKCLPKDSRAASSSFLQSRHPLVASIDKRAAHTRDFSHELAAHS